MKLTIVGPTSPYKGGIALHTTETAHRLAARRDDVTLETWARQYPRRLYPGVQTLDEPEGTPFPATERTLAWYRPETWWRVGRRSGRRSDVVCIALVSPVQFPAYELLARAARRQGAQVIAIAHNVLPHESGGADRRLARRLYQLVDGMLVHSSLEAERATALGARKFAVRPLPFFFDPVSAPSEPTHPRRQLAFVGFVRPYKGLDVLIRALAASDAKPRLTITGEFWDDVDRYRSLARDVGVEHLCDFEPGYCSNVRLEERIDAADALVVPYRSATGTQHPRIARSRRRPSIVTAVGDMAEQVHDGVDGFVVPPDDVAALAGAIDRLYANGEHVRLAERLRPVDPDQEWQAYLGGIDELVDD